ncbi:MAG TPA: hypothetical protein VHU19_07720 [Pyrinomonadaceae bacterium]|nr:hypothetical protein [Pyrinomonadaceae bacterium]
MSKFRFTVMALTITAITLLASSSAMAQASRTWVSGLGDDANPCSRTAPCKTFAGAISKTAVNGEINCIDPGGFGAVTITKSITIDCHEVFASILNAGTNGVNIPFDNFTAVGEVRKTVRLRNLNFNGFDSGLRSVAISGSAGTTGTKVIIEDCMMDGNQTSPGRGIEDFRRGGGLLVIKNTSIRGMLSAAVVVDPTAAGGSSSAQVNVSISDSQFCNNGFGINFGSNVKAFVHNAIIAGNVNSGVFAVQNSGGTTEVAVDSSIVSGNGTGFTASSANTVIRVSNTTAMNNGTLATAAGGGQVSSYGNNMTGGLSFPSSGTSQT